MSGHRLRPPATTPIVDERRYATRQFIGWMDRVTSGVFEGGPADLGFTAGASAGTVTSSTGTDATIPAVDGTNAGLMLPAQNDKLAGIEAGATRNLGALADLDTVAAAQIDDGAVVEAKLGAGSVTSVKLGADAVTEAKLDALDAPNDGEVLSFNTASGRFEWVPPGAGTGVQRVYDTRADLAAATIPPAVDVIFTGGYTAAGDGGSALYKRVGAEPAHSGKVQSADGAWWELAEKLARPEMFGAKIDGVTDDITAWQGLRSYAEARGAVIGMPIGTSLLSARLDFTKPITIVGAGRRQSILKWTSGATNNGGIRITLATQAEVPLIKGLTLMKQADGAEGHVAGDALYIAQTETSLFIGNANPTVAIEDVETTNETKHDFSWANGIVLNDVRQASLRGISCRGSFTSADLTTMFGIGIRVLGASNPISVHLYDLILYRLATAIYITEAEGTYVNKFEIVGCNVGLRYDTNTAGTKQPHLQVGPSGHFNCYDYGVDARDLAQSFIVNVNFMRRPDATGAGFAHIRLRQCSYIHVLGNTFFDDRKVADSYAVEFRGGYACIVGPNTFQMGDICVLIDAASQNISITEGQRIERAAFRLHFVNSGSHVEFPLATRDVKRITHQAIPTNAHTAIVWETGIDGNQADVWSSSAAPARFTCRNAGWHIFHAEIIWEANNLGYREHRFFDGASGSVRTDWSRGRASGEDFIHHITFSTQPVYMTRGQTVELRAWQNSGVTLNVRADSRCSMTWLGP